MKITVISHLYPNRAFPAHGTFIRDLFLNIAKRSQATMLVPAVRTLPFSRKWRYTHAPFFVDNEAERVRYVSVPGKQLPDVIKRNLTAALVRRITPACCNLAHFNWLYPDGLAIPAIEAAGIPTVLTIHGSDWYKTRGSVRLRSLLFQSLHATQSILTVGKALRDDIAHACPELADKIQVTHNALDFSRFKPLSDRTSLMPFHQWTADRKHVLCVANLSYEKGIDILLEASKAFDPDDVQFHIIGNIPGDRYARMILKEIQRYPNITLHPPVPHSTITSYYHACDMVVLPSRNEGFGLSVAEAIACGKPVVATKSGGPEDIVTEENGFLIDTETPEQFAEKIRYILSGSFVFTPQQIHNSIRHKFDSQSVTDHIFTIYQGILKK